MLRRGDASRPAVSPLPGPRGGDVFLHMSSYSPGNLVRRALRRLISGPGPGRRATASPASAGYRGWWDGASATMADAYASTIAPTHEAEYRARGWHGDDNGIGAKQLVAMAGLTTADRVLEIGCGIARTGRELAPHVAEWHGADISPNMLAHAAERTAGLPNVKFHLVGGPGEADGLGCLPDGAYTFVYCTIVFMHLDKEDLFEYLKQAHRLLAPGGRAYFDTWNVLHPDVLRIWRQASRTGDAKPRGRIQTCCPDEFRLYLEEAGFDIVDFHPDDRLVGAFCRRRDAGAAPVADDGRAPFGYVGVPANLAPVARNGVVVVEGWALDGVARVTAKLGDLPEAEATLGLPWPGIAELFPRYPGARAAGWRAELNTAGLAAGVHELVVTATDGAGRVGTLTGYNWSLTVEDGQDG